MNLSQQFKFFKIQQASQIMKERVLRVGRLTLLPEGRQGETPRVGGLRGQGHASHQHPE